MILNSENWSKTSRPRKSLPNSLHVLTLEIKFPFCYSTITIIVSIEGDNRIAAESMFAEILAEPVNQRRSNREAKERRERRTAFLTKADELLGQYPHPESTETEQLTRPVDLMVGVHPAKLQVRKSTSHYESPSGGYIEENATTGLQGTIIETGQVYSLFEIQQTVGQYNTPHGFEYSRKTLVRDHGRNPSDESYRIALSAINFIGEELPKQHPQSS